MLFGRDLLDIVLSIPAILIAFTFHEYAHALVADRLGDRLPRYQGRLTLNPISHIDPLGFLLILLTGFGWAKPVQVNPSAYKKYYKDDLKVSIAGPIANLIVALVFAFIFGAFFMIYAKLPEYNSVMEVIQTMLILIVQINITLFFLNMLPIPGFDGSHVLRDLFPKFFFENFAFVERYQMIIFVALAVPILGGRSILSYLIGEPTSFVFKYLMKLVGLVFGW